MNNTSNRIFFCPTMSRPFHSSLKFENCIIRTTAPPLWHKTCQLYYLIHPTNSAKPERMYKMYISVDIHVHVCIMHACVCVCIMYPTYIGLHEMDKYNG